MQKQSLRLAGRAKESLVDGPGLRYVVFTQGCLHHCPNCHNPESWELKGGEEFSVKEVIRMIKKQINTARASHHTVKFQGITFSGGEPFLQAELLAQVAQAIHQIDLDVVTYTGYTYEELLELEKNNDGITSLLCATDLLIDGKYINGMRTISLPFRGSSNQRIIDVAQTQKSGKIILKDIS
ncbi:MAG: anaerobic ribonucleoside-triphosphate reductase activating protein [Treponema sp.]|nr:anaerobic ribonucleoside-triphosphate reductase activating protein [Treponema sp.]MCL2252156.1 anaerobic ribonucleoside-triphosphate reductase activating protein [Treponema sp.]